LVERRILDVREAIAHHLLDRPGDVPGRRRDVDLARALVGAVVVLEDFVLRELQELDVELLVVLGVEHALFPERVLVAIDVVSNRDFRHGEASACELARSARAARTKSDDWTKK